MCPITINKALLLQEGILRFELSWTAVSLGTNYSELMRNMGIDTIIVTGVVTDQCVAGTVRVLADHGFKVICVEDCCAAPDMTLHEMELKIMNIIYCNVISTNETIELIEKSE